MSSDSCTGIVANPDVAGIGIRLSIYITTLIIALVPNVEETDELRSALWTAAGLNGFALLITALIETANRSLTLYHAIIIMHMLTFLGIATNPAGSYRATPARLILYWLTTWMVFAILLSWIVYVWATAPTFGTPGACNHATIYVILFVNVRATIGWLRWSFVTGAGIALFVMALAPISVIIALCGADTDEDAPAEGDRQANPHPSTSGAELPQQIRRSSSNITELQDITETHAPPAPTPGAFAGVSAVPATKTNFFVQASSTKGILGRFVAAVYGVVMLELTIRRNKKNVSGDENQWAFGQIVAMLVTVGSLNEVFHFLLAEYDKWKHARRQNNPGSGNLEAQKTPEKTPDAAAPPGYGTGSPSGSKYDDEKS